METIVKNKTVKLDIDTGLDHGSIFSRDELIAKLAILEADIKAKKKEQEELRQYAVDAGLAQWKLSNEGKSVPKAPAMGWWTTHRAASFEKQCEATEDPKHPEHSCFWAKPRKTFTLI
jgi:hypothetical protein